MSTAQVVNALATAQLEAKRIADEAAEDNKATGAQDFDLQVENMSKVWPIPTRVHHLCSRGEIRHGASQQYVLRHAHGQASSPGSGCLAGMPWAAAELAGQDAAARHGRTKQLLSGVINEHLR